MAEESFPRYDEMSSADVGQAYACPQPRIEKASVEEKRRLSGYQIVKCALDIASSACALAVLWPLLVVICAAIQIDSKGSAIYRHRRVGKNFRPIYLYNARSMLAVGHIA